MLHCCTMEIRVLKQLNGSKKLTSPKSTKTLTGKSLCRHGSTGSLRPDEKTIRHIQVEMTSYVQMRTNKKRFCVCDCTDSGGSEAPSAPECSCLMCLCWRRWFYGAVPTSLPRGSWVLSWDQLRETTNTWLKQNCISHTAWTGNVKADFKKIKKFNRILP